MHKFQFQLDPVLRLKEQLLKQTERKLAKVASTKSKAEQHIESLKREISKINQELTSTEHRLASNTWHTSLRRAAAIEVQIEQACIALAAVREQWHQTKNEYLRLSGETETLRRLRLEKKQGHDHQTATIEQAELDELVIRKWHT
jgi:flagellar export protein FliJ